MTLHKIKTDLLKKHKTPLFMPISHIVVLRRQVDQITATRRPCVSGECRHLTPSPCRLLSDNEIVCFLKVQLAEAINLQDKNQMAQIQETTRCVGRFDARTCRKLLAAIADDYR